MSGTMITVDPMKATTSEVYQLMISAIVPRPIALVSTVSQAGIGNLAPFSYFNAVSSDPATLMISIARKPDGTKKDTLRNIEETGQFVVNVSSESMAQAINQSSANYPYGVDEMHKVGLTPLASERVRAPRVAESPVHLECETYKTMEVGSGGAGSTTIVVGRILLIHVGARAYDQGTVLIREIAPLTRLGGQSYGKLGEVFDLPRPVTE